MNKLLKYSLRLARTKTLSLPLIRLLHGRFEVSNQPSGHGAPGQQEINQLVTGSKYILLGSDICPNLDLDLSYFTSLHYQYFFYLGKIILNKNNGE